MSTTKNEVTETVVNTTEDVLNEVTDQVAETNEFNWRGFGIITLGVGLVVGIGVYIYKKVKGKNTTEEVKPEEATEEVEETSEPVEAQA